MLTDEEITTGRKVIGVMMVLVVVYLVASVSGIIPPSANVFEWMKDSETQYTDGDGYITGIPDTVNITEELNNTYVINVGCNESYIGDFDVILIPSDNFDETEIYWTATTTDWVISNDGLTIKYVGQPLTIGIEISEAILHINSADDEVGNIDILIISRIGTIENEVAEIEVIV